jgi:hypothetical protein
MTLERALRHRRGPEEVWEVPADLTLDGMNGVFRALAGPDHMVGFCSHIVCTNGESRHALLMDFRCTPSSTAQNELEHACLKIGYGGWLLQTSRSYHFIGEVLVDEQEWLRFMGYWLLLEHLVDVSFIGHCVIERLSCLRVTGSTAFPEPVVVAYFEAAASPLPVV